MRPPVTDFDPRLPIFFVPDLQRIDRRMDLVKVRNELAQVFLEIGRIEYRLKWRLGDRLPGVLVEGRLGIETLDVAHPPDEKDPDDTLGPGLKMRAPVRRLPERRRITRPNDSLVGEHLPEHETRESHADVGKKRPPARPATGAPRRARAVGPRIRPSWQMLRHVH